MIKKLMTLLLPLFFLVSATFPHALAAQSSQTLDVYIRNFPETQQVKGSVAIEGTASHSKFVKREGILVPPSRRNELSELTFAGILEADGFTSISANLQGEIRDTTCMK